MNISTCNNPTIAAARIALDNKVLYLITKIKDKEEKTTIEQKLEWFHNPGAAAKQANLNQLFDYVIKDADEHIFSNQNSDLALKLHFIREIIFFLNQTKRVYTDRPYYLADLSYLYWFLSSTDKTTDPALAVEACEKYLEICMSDVFDDWFASEMKQYALKCEKKLNPKKPEEGNKPEGQSKTTREDQILGINKHLLKLLEQDKEEIKIEELRKKIFFWLIKRYNINQAREILYYKKDWRRWLASYAPEFSAFIMLTGLFIITLEKLPVSISNFLIVNFKWMIILEYLFMLLIAILLGFSTIHPKTESNFQIHLPRLAASIVVGYFLLLNDEAWGSLIGNNFLLYTGKILVPLGAVFVYILIEMNNVKGIKKDCSLLKKGGILFFRGAAYSYLIGIIVSDLFGQAFVDRISGSHPICSLIESNPGIIDTIGRSIFEKLCSSGAGLAWAEGAFGRIYPAAIFLLSPLALFIGIFLQILWEDKSITEKI